MNERLEALLNGAGGLVADAACAVGRCAAGAAEAARRKLRQADTRAEIHLRMRELGELLYATHTGTPTDSDVLREKMEQIDALQADLAAGEAKAPAPRRCGACGAKAAAGASFCKHCGNKL